MSNSLGETLGIAGSGAVARGLARVAAPCGEVVLYARSNESALSTRAALDGAVTVVTDLAELGRCTYLVESVREDAAVKADVIGRLAAVASDEAILASTTSSLSIAELARASGRVDRFAGLHVFNPVERMQLVELAFPPEASEETRARSRELCEALGKTPVEVPDAPGFVVNRLLFPYLFAAVRLLERHELEPQAVDSCMKLGAGHPMGPLALLDFVGLDVAAAIGRTLGEEVPRRLRELVDEGALGRKSGRGFYSY